MIVVFIAALLLALFEGSSIRSAGEEMDQGIAASSPWPWSWRLDRDLPVRRVDGRRILAFIEDDGVGRGRRLRGTRLAAGGRAWVPAVAWSFDPAELGSQPAVMGRLDTLLVTGDSRRCRSTWSSPAATPMRAKTLRWSATLTSGTGISKTGLVDWGGCRPAGLERGRTQWWCSSVPTRASICPGRETSRCVAATPDWAAAYAYRVRRMMNTYRRNGRARVYWLTLPAPREDRQEIARAVNAAIEVAAQPYARARVLAMDDLFTPGGRYRDAAMETAAARSSASRTASTSTAAAPSWRRGWSSSLWSATWGLDERVGVLDRPAALAAGDLDRRPGVSC